MEVQLALQGQMVLKIWDVEHGACAMLQHQTVERPVISRVKTFACFFPARGEPHRVL